MPKLKESTGYTCICDACGKLLMDSDGNTIVKHTAEFVNQVAIAKNWFVGDSDQHICPKCQKRMKSCVESAKLKEASSELIDNINTVIDRIDRKLYFCNGNANFDKNSNTLEVSIDKFDPADEDRAIDIVEKSLDAYYDFDYEKPRITYDEDCAYIAWQILDNDTSAVNEPARETWNAYITYGDTLDGDIEGSYDAYLENCDDPVEAVCQIKEEFFNDELYDSFHYALRDDRDVTTYIKVDLSPNQDSDTFETTIYADGTIEGDFAEELK